jgi:hypothetical protein
MEFQAFLAYTSSIYSYTWRKEEASRSRVQPDVMVAEGDVILEIVTD